MTTLAAIAHLVAHLAATAVVFAAAVVVAAVAAVQVLATIASTETITTIIALVVAMLNPFITARITSANARRLVKIGVSFGLSAIAGAVAAWGHYQSGVRDWTLITMAAFGTAQLVYHTADAAFERTTGRDLNEQTWAEPDQGI